jgi:hypothetical protein
MEGCKRGPLAFAAALLAFAAVAESFNWNENVAPKLRVNYLSQQSGKLTSPYRKRYFCK